MELREHLVELRQRLVRSIGFLFIGAIIAYNFFTPLYTMLHKPLQVEMERQNALRTKPTPQNGNVLVIPPPTGDSKKDYQALSDAIQWVHAHPNTAPMLANTFKGFQDPFMVRIRLSVIFGFILATPFIIRELALFILPALTPQERRPLRMLVPLSVTLLAMGVFTAYRTMFFAIPFFLSYLADYPPPNNLLQDPNDYVLFLVKAMAAFGLAFQLPVVLMALSFLGLVTSKGLIKQWRWGFVLGAAGGLFTPANDLVSMGMLSIPLVVLYFLSIFLVRMVERMKANPKPT
jgi:sec-independent protein translocase protein TatC